MKIIFLPSFQHFTSFSQTRPFGHSATLQTEKEDPSSNMASQEQLNANRENAQKSLGPISEAGRTRCQEASVTHGLTSVKILMSTDDKSAYERSVANTFDRLNPVTDPEKAMVQFIADHEWKLARSFVWEQGIIAKGRYECRDSFLDVEDPDLRELIILGHIHENHGKALSNCSAETARVQRMVSRSIADYETVRRERELVETAQRNVAMDSIMGKAGDLPVKHPTVGTLYPLPFLVARVQFKNCIGTKFLPLFDRAWTDPKVKPACYPWIYGEPKPKPAA